MNHKLILIRHATTVAGKSALVGKNDVELSAQGIEDARNLKTGITLQNSNVRYYSSKLKRATQTREILFPGVECACDARINEVDFGDWTGLSFDEISLKFPEGITEWSRNPMRFRFPGGESVEEFIVRINDFLDSEILQKNKINVLVCHGGAIRFIICRMLNIDYAHHLSFSIQRPSLNVIDHDGKTGVLTGLNLTSLLI